MSASHKSISHAYVSDEALTMMRRVLLDECTRREVDPSHSTGQDLAAIIMHAFQSGMTEETDLVVLIRNLAD